MEKTGISDFRELLTDVSNWYDVNDFLKMLKVLYRDNITIAYKLDNASNTIELLSLLCGSGDLSPTDLTILYDTIKITGQFGLERKIKDKITSCPNIREIEISKFSEYRTKLMEFGFELTLKDVANIRRLYHLRVKKDEDVWDTIMDLEHTMTICEIDELIKHFRENKIHHPPYDIRQMNVYTLIPMMMSIIILVIGIIAGVILIMAIPEPSIDDNIREYFTDRQKDLYKDLITMTPTTWSNEHGINLTEIFTDLDLLKSTKRDEKEKPTSKRRKAKKTTLAEVLNVVKSTDSCKVLITGNGGMGKTTLLRYIAHNWATNSDDTFVDKLLFLINIRDIKADENFLDALMQEITTPVVNKKNTLSKDSIESFLKIHAYEIVLLLDGFDELRVGAKNPIQLFKDYDLKKYTVMLTSRPENTIGFANRCDVHVHVKGFDPRNIKNYIVKHFDILYMKDQGESLIRELEVDSFPVHRYSRHHNEAFELCRSPYLLVMICSMWRANQSIPKDLPELYKEIFLTTINQYISKSSEETSRPISQFDRIPQKYASAILALGKCMYRSLLINSLSIDRYDMEAEVNDKTVFNLALKIGFVYKDYVEVEYDLREIYTTPHKLLSEALAGFYISIASQEERLKDDEYETIRSNEYLHMTRVLAIGFMGSNAGELLKHWLIIKASNYYSLATYFDYIKTEHEESVLHVLIGNMSTEMKEHVKDMANSLRVFLYGKDTIHREKHLLQLIITFANSFEKFTIEASAEMKTSVQSPAESICRMIAHITLMLHVISESVDDNYLFYTVKQFDDEAMKIILTELEKHHLNDEIHSLIFTNTRDNIEIAQLCKILEIAPKLNVLKIDRCGLSGITVNTIIEKCQNKQVLFELRTLNIANNKLHDINGTLLSKLLKKNKHKTLHMQYCYLKGNILGDMIKECDRMGIVLKDQSIGLEGNDLSNIDGESLMKLINVLSHDNDGFITWRNFMLSADNLKDLVNACDENCRFKFKRVKLNNINLSSFSGNTLANLFKIFPHLKDLHMMYCNLTVNIVGEMLNECDRMGVVSKDYSLGLDGNDLSNIDGESLVKLVNVLSDDYHGFIWRNYNLSADNLNDLLNACDENCRFKFQKVKLNNINLSSFSGTTLANLFKIFPHLDHLDMNKCNLTGNIVGDMLNECDRMGLVLKYRIIELDDNDLSNIDGESLVKLVNVVNGNNYLNLPNYNLSADNLKYLLNACKENCRFLFKSVRLDYINLSSFSGTTLANLFKIFPYLKHLNMFNCNLTVNIVGEMLNECDRMGVVLKDHALALDGNDLSNIGGESLVKLLNVLSGQPDVDRFILTWRNYNLSADNLQELVNACDENCRFKFKKVKLNNINLSSLSGTTLANLFIIFPHLTHLYMNNCNLTGNIVGDMLNECDMMGIVLKDHSIRLRGNDLSNIDCESLVKLLNVIRNFYIIWRNYDLSADNLQELVNACENCRFKFEFVSLSEVNRPLFSRTLPNFKNFRRVKYLVITLTIAI